MTNEQMRREFEEWYACNAFDFVANPIGSRDCGLQWKSWQAATIKANQWRPIADAPKDQTAILVIGTLHSMLQPCPIVVVAYFDRGWWAQSGGVVTYVTHWQPLPLPPTGTRGNDVNQ